MTIIESITAGFAELKALLTSKSSLDAELTKLKAELEQSQSQIKGYIEASDNFKAKLEAATAQGSADAKNIIDLTASLKAKDEEIATLKAEAKSSGRQAAEMLSNAGLPAGQLPAGNGNQPSKQEQIDGLRESLKTASATDKFKICQQIKALLAAKS